MELNTVEDCLNKFEELKIEDAINICNLFLNEIDADDGRAYDLWDDGYFNEVLGIDFCKSFFDLGLHAITGFNYYYETDYYIDRWLKTEEEAKNAMYTSIESYLDDDNKDKLIELFLELENN